MEQCPLKAVKYKRQVAKDHVEDYPIGRCANNNDNESSYIYRKNSVRIKPKLSTVTSEVMGITGDSLL